jgi:hypothetical protein
LAPNTSTQPRFNRVNKVNRVYAGLLSLSMIWAVVNCLYVYLALGGDRAYRLESAVIVLVIVALPAIVSRGWPGEFIAGTPSTLCLALLALAVGLWLAFAIPLVTFPFLSDDYGFLHAYRSMADAARPFQFYRPGFAVAFVVLGGIGGGSPVPFHVAGFLLHLASAALVFSLARTLFATPEPAVVACVLFLLSPIQLESVLWVSGLQEQLWAFFILAAARCYIGDRELRPRRIAAVLALMACGLASKETAVCVVLLLPSADFLLFRFKRGRFLAIAYAGVALELTAYLVIRHRMLPVDETFFVRPSHYFVKQFLAMPYEIFLHPWNQSAVHVPVAALCVTALGGIAGVFAVAWRGSGARVFAGPALVIMSTLPVYSLFYVSPELAGSRYLYFATAGFALVVADALTAVVRSRPLWAFCVVALAVGSAISLKVNVRPWQTAGAFVTALRDGIHEGKSPDDVTREWQAHGATGMSVRDGVPQEYRGVGVLKNGYPEFVELARTRSGI